MTFANILSYQEPQPREVKCLSLEVFSRAIAYRRSICWERWIGRASTEQRVGRFSFFFLLLLHHHYPAHATCFHMPNSTYDSSSAPARIAPSAPTILGWIIIHRISEGVYVWPVHKVSWVFVIPTVVLCKGTKYHLNKINKTRRSYIGSVTCWPIYPSIILRHNQFLEYTHSTLLDLFALSP